jgi:hypothetical protein
MIVSLVASLVALATAHYYNDEVLYEDAYYQSQHNKNIELATNDLPQGSEMANCGGDFTDIRSYLFPSNELQPGEEAYLYTEYNAPFEVENGYVLTSITFNGVPYPQFNSSLCFNAESTISKFLRSPFNYLKSRYYEKLTSVECPITTGQHSKNSSFTVPNDSGILKSKIAWFSDTGRLLLCLKIAAEILQPNVIHNHNRI